MKKYTLLEAGIIFTSALIVIAIPVIYEVIKVRHKYRDIRNKNKLNSISEGNLQ